MASSAACRAAGPRQAAAGDGHEPFLQRWLFSTRLAYVAVAVMALLAIGVGGWWLTAGRYKTVPTVAGMSVTAASQALVQAGFHVRNGSSLIDDNVPKGNVVSVSPSGRALPGATIVVTGSLGPRMIIVPPVLGKSVADAMAALKAAGLTVSSTTKPVGVSGNVVVNSVAGTTRASAPHGRRRSQYLDVVAGSVPPLTGEDIGTIQQWAATNHINLQQKTVTSSKPQGSSWHSLPRRVDRAAGRDGQRLGLPGTAGGVDPQQPGRPAVPAGAADAPEPWLHGYRQEYFFGNKVISISPSGQAPQGSTITVYYGGF